MMPSLPKRDSSVSSIDETNAERFDEQNTDRSSRALENQQA
jgi:hypothetical protein